MLVVYAKTDPGAGAHGITAFLIEKGLQGFRPRRSWTSSACAARQPSELVFEDCEVPDENVLGERRSTASSVLMSGLDYERRCSRPARSASCRPAWTWCCPTCTSASSSARPIGEFQLMQGKLADMYTTLNAVPGLCLCGGAGLRSRPHHAQGCRRRDPVFAAEKATWMALEAIQCLGGNGYINDYPAGRLLRDAKLYEIGAGTSEIRRMLIGRELFDGN